MYICSKIKLQLFYMFYSLAFKTTTIYALVIILKKVILLRFGQYPAEHIWTETQSFGGIEQTTSPQMM